MKKAGAEGEKHEARKRAGDLALVIGEVKDLHEREKLFHALENDRIRLARLIADESWDKSNFVSALQAEVRIIQGKLRMRS